MTEFRSFEPTDTPWTLFGLAFGLFYGAMTIGIVLVLGLGVFVILLIGLPFLIVQLVAIIGFDRFLKWRRRDDPPPPPTAWLRHHAISIGAAIGAGLALIWALLGNLP